MATFSSGIDPYIGQAGVLTGTKDRTKALTTAYALVMAENSGRVGFTFESPISSGDTIFLRYGTSGPIYELGAGGSFSRNKHTGDVWVGEIWAKIGTGTGSVIAEEN